MGYGGLIRLKSFIIEAVGAESKPITVSFLEKYVFVGVLQCWVDWYIWLPCLIFFFLWYFSDMFFPWAFIFQLCAPPSGSRSFEVKSLIASFRTNSCAKFELPRDFSCPKSELPRDFCSESYSQDLPRSNWTKWISRLQCFTNLCRSSITKSEKPVKIYVWPTARPGDFCFLERAPDCFYLLGLHIYLHCIIDHLWNWLDDIPALASSRSL